MSDFGNPYSIYTEPKGMVRLLIGDLAEAESDRIFSDDQLDAFLALRGGSIHRAAAQALLVMAASEVMVSKVIRTQDLTTDGAKVSAELRALAKTLTETADAEDAAVDGSFFDVVPFAPYGHLEGSEYRL